MGTDWHTVGASNKSEISLSFGTESNKRWERPVRWVAYGQPDFKPRAPPGVTSEQLGSAPGAASSWGPHSSEKGLAQSQARTLGWQLWTRSPGCTGNQRFYGNLAGAGQRAIRHPEEQLLKIARPMPDFGCPPGGRDGDGAHPARPAGGSPSFP